MDEENNLLRIKACLKACEGISTENLEKNRPVSWLAAEYNKALKERDNALSCASLSATRCRDLLEALKDVCGAVSSVNSGPQNAININGARAYWQTEEWVRWMLDEILPVARAAAAKAEGDAQ